MFGIDGGEFVVLALLALFLLGPERLPGLAKQAARALHDVRRWAQRTREDIGRELGPEFENFDLADLNPKKFVQKHLLDPLEDDDEDSAGRTFGGPALATRTGGHPGPGGSPDSATVSLEKSATEVAALPARTVALRELSDGAGADSGHHDGDRSDADGGRAVDLVDVRVGPDLTTDVFAPQPAQRPAPSTHTVPAWSETASAWVADYAEADDVDLDLDLDVGVQGTPAGSAGDESTAWTLSYYVAPPIDLDAT